MLLEPSNTTFKSGNTEAILRVSNNIAIIDKTNIYKNSLFCVLDKIFGNDLSAGTILFIIQSH